jgi:hypothetical protein
MDEKGTKANSSRRDCRTEQDSEAFPLPSNISEDSQSVP